MGRNHLIAGFALAGAAGVGLSALSDPDHRVTQWLDGLGETVTGRSALMSGLSSWALEWLVPVSDAGLSLALVGYLVLAAALYAVGCLLPDIDSRKSLLGRWVPFQLPGPHHGLTHTDWLLWLLFGLSLIEPLRPVAFLWLGAWSHCELDGLSRAGRVRFYPVSAYDVIALPDGRPCVVPRGFHRGLYRVGKPSERVVLVGVVLLCVLVMVASLVTA